MNVQNCKYINNKERRAHCTYGNIRFLCGKTRFAKLKLLKYSKPLNYTETIKNYTKTVQILFKLLKSI